MVHKVRRLELDHCGHSPHRDCPDQVLDAMRTFLADVDQGGEMPIRVADSRN
jgi:pimeloyl-ACP methyl ester carboxylesterase